MKKSKKVLSVIFAICLVLTFSLESGVVYALKTCDCEGDSCSYVSDLNQTLRNENGWCPECLEYYLTAECMGRSMAKWLNSSTHTPLFGETCNITWYSSSVRIYCQGCGYFHGWAHGHTCYKKHHDCGLGIDSVCWFGGP